MNGFEKRTALIKDKIMKTTISMLNTWEPKRLRIADIAREAGVSQVTIYNYFGSKEALISESFKDFIQQAIDEFREEMRRQQSLKELIAYSLLRRRRPIPACRRRQSRRLWLMIRRCTYIFSGNMKSKLYR